MNNFDEKVQLVRDELEKMTKQYGYIQTLIKENEAQQASIIEQNIIIKHRNEELDKSQKKVVDKENELSTREKQILIKEKSIIASNKLLEEKMEALSTKALDVETQSRKLQKDLEEYYIQKKVVDRQTILNKQLEEADALRKSKLSLREKEIERELERLKSMSL